jgi:hypothetical protein
VIDAIEMDETLPESTYGKLEVQFNQLVRDPLEPCTGRDAGIYKVVVIDAVDECTNLNVASSLIKLILRSAHNIPLKIFIASRDEPPIRAAFDVASSLRHRFILHEVEKDVVEGDIRRYIETSLSEIQVYAVIMPRTCPDSSTNAARCSSMQQLPFVISQVLVDSPAIDCLPSHIGQRPRNFKLRSTISTDRSWNKLVQTWKSTKSAT